MTMLLLQAYIFPLTNIVLFTIERCSRVVSTPASYLGGPEIKTRPGGRLS
jgi:hypothetical protein